MNAFLSQIVSRTAMAALVGVTASSAAAQSLVDPSYELLPSTLDSYGVVLNNFAAKQGIWGAESGAITGPVGAVTPAHLFQMLQMHPTGGNLTQTVQVVNATALPAVTTGWTATLSADFTNDSNLPAVAGMSLSFFSAANYASMIGTTTYSSFTTDPFPQTWQPWSLSLAIPSGTQWIVSEVYFSNPSLQGGDGYVDAAQLSVVPEPASLTLLALGSVLAARRRIGVGRARGPRSLGA